MDCLERKKLYNSKREVERELRQFSLPPATEPLGIDTPETSHLINNEYKSKKRATEEKLKQAVNIYQKHIENCTICSGVAKRQRKT